MALITLAELKTFMGITDSSLDSELTPYVNSIDAIVEQLTGRKITKVASQAYYFGGDGSMSLVLPYYPVSILHSFQYNEDALGNSTRVDFDTSYWSLEATAGIVHLNIWLPRGRNNIKAVITAGYDNTDAPGDLKTACFAVISELRTRAKSAGVVSESVDGASLTYASSGSFSDTTMALLDKYVHYDI